ncbi:MAG: ABC transporter ATP-binding protein [Victivallales bacterium]|nr:ABC transporter ATP-binding protein [Victivallales bacterium]MCF7888481.1 ABC transporter ATP-binding protein [Victivallales bacterium]
MALLEVKNLNLELNGKKILNNLNFEIWKGYVHAIMGTNGAGKSTLANTIMGLSGYENISGDILFKGKSLKTKTISERARDGITLGWQEPARYEGLKIEDFLNASAKRKNTEELKKALSTVGIKPEDHLNRAVDKTLSGGERKKIELASILLMEPEIAFLDEPDSGIDIESISRIFEVVKILKEKGTTVVFITHSLAVLSRADHAFLMCKGQIVDKGDRQKIKNYFKEECIECEIKDPEVKKEEKRTDER